ncbi:MAG: DUF2199 domain-containing protein [Pseudomonadota bacterium]
MTDEAARLEDCSRTCGCCGEPRRGVPDYAFRRPDAVVARGDGAVLHVDSNDLCDVEANGARRVFLRGVLLIPLRAIPGQSFGYGPWVEVQRDDARRYVQATRDGDVGALAPLPATLANDLPGCEGTTGLPVALRGQPNGQRPSIDAAVASPHRLAAEQRDGWDAARLRAVLADGPFCRGTA